MSASAVERVERLVRDRAALRPAFARFWPRQADQNQALIEDLAAATLELSRVNAGPACIEALWKATGHGILPVVSSGGRAAADICRHAGSRAALACLEAVPAATRLTGGRREDLAAWWQGLHRLSREAPALVPDTARRVETLLAAGDGLAFTDFVAAGLKATATDPARRAAFFALDDPLAAALLERRSGAGGFADAQRMLEAFAAGLWGVEPRLKAGPPARRTVIASGLVILPPVFAGTPAARTRLQYRAAVAHAQAHLAHPPVRHAIGTLKPLQVALVGLVEDARVEALVIRRLPGLRHLWAEFHDAQPGGIRTAVSLMLRLSRGLLDPTRDDADGFVAKGRGLFAAAADRLEDPAISREIGGLLGNDLGQMRLQFNAATYVVEPAYRDDNMHLWELPDTPDDALSMAVDAARGTDHGDGDHQQGDAPAAPRARDAGLDHSTMLLANYPEWDAVAGVERPDWTSLRDAVPVLRDPAPNAPGEWALRARIARLVRSSVVGRNVRQSLREDGEELDIDAAISAAVARRAGLQQDRRVYRDRRPRGRDLSTLIILDVSQSTAAIDAAGLSVLTAERLAVEALASALDARGDCYALRAFASAGRDDVRLTRLKDFDEPFTAIVGARLAGLSPGLSTRLGAALRHAGAELAPLRTTRKLVLVLTDGEPSDIDVPRPNELVEDARRAVAGLRRQGVDVFGVVMDPLGAGSGATIFGRHNAIAIRRLEELPAKLAGLYFRLALR
ncbi:nitric oxide reductase activation protein NorD [Rhodopila sp.]|uniref:nitric oxide reductase activation protein NorD n=1 Tax=Rhodopila sp. TaxID=2480087 RepID=UPI003D132CC4